MDATDRVVPKYQHPIVPLSLLPISDLDCARPFAKSPRGHKAHDPEADPREVRGPFGSIATKVHGIRGGFPARRGKRMLTEDIRFGDRGIILDVPVTASRVFH